MFRRKTLLNLILSVLIAVTFTYNVNACFNPADINAVEVLFNKYGASYNLTALVVKFKPIVVEEGGIYVFKYVYRASKRDDLQFGVTVYLEKICGDAPCVEGYNEDKPMMNVLALRIELLDTCSLEQITTTTKYSSYSSTVRIEKDTYTTNNITTYTSTVEKKCPEKTVVSLVFNELLNKLTSEGVIIGLSIEDINKIMDAVISNPIVAGWNNRLLYNDKIDRWAPYAELINAGLIKGVLVKGPLCSYKLPQEVIDEVMASEPGLIIEEQALITPTTTPTLIPQVTVTVTVKEKEIITLITTTTSLYTIISNQGYPSQPIPSPQPYPNGLVTVISISIGIAGALVIYAILRLTSKT
ncbi:MAG: hypothetical protein QW775_06390 [Ignisphaera sp.]|uniref:Uncharacterized protein n=1 Tax=Ignisphaera aggregans TaxID=334771 RepID=A0A7C4JIE2_9CREN